jgi:hypothetical protein
VALTELTSTGATFFAFYAMMAFSSSQPGIPPYSHKLLHLLTLSLSFFG